ncbi:hypothetical protein ILUMI_10237 [Ignelater luminosus]|uniref:Metaxin n=1 Tax=Ignelater luminosus TaxID=2038154 RepID=A0A8K0D3N0_IGNLU|nr:hypothetical protein ILUMI_10237 [Ignelater luminosus]
MFEDNNPVYPRMMLPSPVILRVWENDFGVPSVDPECLQLMLLFKMHGVNVVVHQAYCPLWLDIPSIQFNDHTVTRGPDLFLHALSLCRRSTDMVLDTGSHSSRLTAYKKYFMESFADVFYYDCWLNDINYEHAIKTWFNNVIPFPLSYFYLKRMREEAKTKFKGLLGSRDPDKYMMRQHQYAARCLEDFAGLLKDGRCYFFGDFPTVLDVIIYSYLAVCLRMPLPDPRLQNLIKNNLVLVRYVRNITQNFFPDTSAEFKYVEPVNATYDCASTKSLIIAGLCATTAMFLYACSIGLVKFQFRSVDYIHNK